MLSSPRPPNGRVCPREMRANLEMQCWSQRTLVDEGVAGEALRSSRAGCALHWRALLALEGGHPVRPDRIGWLGSQGR